MLNGMADGALTGAITGAVTGALTSPYCFVAGTAVLAAAGAVAIETIQAGDMVWAWDEETGEVALKEVVETYVNETYELVHVFVNGEEIVTTPGHPFYSPVKGWTDAVNLRAGDILVLINGEYVVVEKIQHEILETPVTVYNFQVEDYHTYYVTNAGVLVHNMCAKKAKLVDLSPDELASSPRTPQEVIKYLQKRGFHQARQTGSHVMMVNESHPLPVPVPYHKGKDLKEGTLRSILKLAGLL